MFNWMSGELFPPKWKAGNDILLNFPSIMCFFFEVFINRSPNSLPYFRPNASNWPVHAHSGLSKRRMIQSMKVLKINCGVRYQIFFVGAPVIKRRKNIQNRQLKRFLWNFERLVLTGWHNFRPFWFYAMARNSLPLTFLGQQKSHF